MVDISIDEIKKLYEAYEAFKASINDASFSDKAKRAYGNLGLSFDSFKQKAYAGAAAIKEVKSAVQDIEKASFDKVISGLSSFKDNLIAMAKNSGITSEQIKKMAVSIGSVVAIGSGRLKIATEFAEMGSAADGSSVKISNMFDTMLQAAPELNKLGVSTLFKNLSGQIDVAKNVETSLLMTAAAAGNLESVYESMGEGLDGLTDMSLEFSEVTSEIGTANNRTAGQVALLANEFSKIPGAMGMIIDRTDESKTKMHMLDATLKVADGTFQDVRAVMGDVDFLFKNWNKTGNDSLTFVARMSSAAQSLKMPMDIMRGYVKEVGNQFKFLGDNTMGAIDIMTRMEPALKKSGLGPAAIGELVSTVTSNISKLDVAQRGFLSSRTGGTGGLQGGYEVAFQMQQGNLQGVASQVEDALRSMFGGNIVTLDEGRKDAGAAAQLTKQVQMLTQGPLAIAGSEQQAFKILDAMASGKLFDESMVGGATPEDHLNQAIERGNAIQERQTSELIKIHNVIQQGAFGAANVVYSDSRKIFGNEGSRAGEITDMRSGASAGAAGTDFQKGAPKTQEERIINFADDTEKYVMSAGKKFNKLISKFTGTNLLPQEAAQGATLPGAQPIDTVTGEPTSSMPAARTRQDMSVARDSGIRQETVGSKPKASVGGKENIIVIRVESDEDIKKIVRVVLNEDGIERVEQGHVASGLSAR